MDENKYLIAKRNHQNAVAHLQATQNKQRKCLKQVKAYTLFLQQQEEKLQRINESLALAVEKLRLAKETYGPLRAEWKLLNPKKERGNEQQRESHDSKCLEGSRSQ
ncbi:MAG: hypothetical protein WCC97_14430 [Candidatus Acidiferrales bacterium]